MKTLSRGNNNQAFALKVIIDQVLSQTKAYKESTIRTHITSKMCANAPVNHAMVYKDLFRVDVGYYRLNGGSTDLERTVRPEIRRTQPANLGSPFAAQDRKPNISVTKLKSIVRQSTLIVLPCSGSKASGGTNSKGNAPLAWSPELQRARVRMHDKAEVDERALMPAWLRYTGGFYQSAGSFLAEAVASNAHIVILSGGYGLVRADENIGTYEKKLNPADWSGRVLEDALVAEAIRVGAKSVVAFAASTTGYAQIVRSTSWNRAGVKQAVLVTAHIVGGGAMSKVPRDLGFAFAAFWKEESDVYPSSIRVEDLI